VNAEQRQADEYLRRARQATRAARAAGTLRPTPSGITRPLLTLRGAK